LNWSGLAKSEVQVQRNERTSFAYAVQDQLVIECRLQMLLRDGADIVTRRFQRDAGVIAEVLVELELHATSSIGIGT
jgi:hypothetical protein